MREGGQPSFPPSARDAIILGGTVFDLLDRERGPDACEMLVVAAASRGRGRATSRWPSTRRCARSRATWRRYLRELPRAARARSTRGAATGLASGSRAGRAPRRGPPRRRSRRRTWRGSGPAARQGEAGAGSRRVAAELGQELARGVVGGLRDEDVARAARRGNRGRRSRGCGARRSGSPPRAGCPGSAAPRRGCARTPTFTSSPPRYCGLTLRARSVRLVGLRRPAHPAQTSGIPHCEQKRSPAGCERPQRGHASGAPPASSGLLDGQLDLLDPLVADRERPQRPARLGAIEQIR